MTVEGRVYRNELVRIVDLAVTMDVLEEYVFEGCEIVGPAVLLLVDGVQLRDCRLEGPETLWDLASQRGYIGGVGIKACLFEGCTLRRIGLAGPPEVMAALRRDFGIA